jgi:gluconolactonase
MTRRTITISIVSLVVSTAYANTVLGRAGNVTIPSQSVVRRLSSFLNRSTSFSNQVVDPKSFAVLPDNFTFRTDSFNQLFNPTNSQEFPIFQIFNPAFLDIIGPSPSISEIASNSTFAFAHEAPIYVSDTDEVFFASNDGGPLGLSGINQNNAIFRLNLTEAERMLGSGGNQTVNVPITQVKVSNWPIPNLLSRLNHFPVTINRSHCRIVFK